MSGEERRQFSRIPVDLVVNLDLPDGKQAWAQAVDFSKTGAAIECDEATAQLFMQAMSNQASPQKLTLRWLDPMGAGQASVQQLSMTSVNVRPDSNGNYRIGLRHDASGNPADSTLDMTTLVIPNELNDIFRQIFEQICLELTQQSAPTIVVTSAKSGEGVSTVAWWLAVSLASRDLGDILYLDTQLQKTRIRPSNHDKKIGLLELIKDPTQLEQINNVSASQNLFVMDAWPAPNTGTVQVSEQQLSDAIQILKKKFAFILIDAQPLMSSPLTLAFARQCDGVLMVIEANRTDRYQVENAMELLKRGNAKILGAILNKLGTA